MKQVFTILLVAIFGMLSCSTPQKTVMIVPEPISVDIHRFKRGFLLDEGVSIKAVSEAEMSVAGLLAADIEKICGLAIHVSQTASAKEIRLTIDSASDLPAEGYSVEVSSDCVKLSASTDAGLFYATRTFVQLLPAQPTEAIPACSIRDFPRMAWRGVMLDVSRHFFTVDQIKKLLDIAALHKLNTFHWHLTDNHGWRLQIDRYPLLTSKAAWRADRTGLPWRQRSPRKEGEECTYGGFYTKDDVRDILAYAARRNIAVIPEIEMPGHCVEVFSAYPQYSCRGVHTEVPVGGVKIGNDVFCAGNEDVFVFLENIIDEVSELFPSKYIHLGGDEVSETRWHNCPKCQKRIVEENLKDESGLQAYFVGRMYRYIASKGKTAIGWDEVMCEGIDKDLVVMSWRGYENGIAAARAGHKVIFTPSSQTYLNFYQASPDFEPAARSAFVTSLRTAYEFDPLPKELTADESAMVLGGQACVWCEYVPTFDYLQYMLLPRLGATAEALWSIPSRRNWDAFVAKQTHFCGLYDSFGYNHSDSSFRVDVNLKYRRKGKVEVELSSCQASPDIRYTFDVSEPVSEWRRYKRPFTVEKEATVYAAIFINEEMKEAATVQHIVPQNMAYGCEVCYLLPSTEKYGKGSVTALVDGIYGDCFRVDKAWQGFEGEMSVVVDLHRVETVNSIYFNLLYMPSRKMLLPKQITVSGSADNEAYSLLGVADTVEPEIATASLPTSIKCNTSSPVRYVRITAKNANSKDLIMIDEIVIK